MLKKEKCIQVINFLVEKSDNEEWKNLLPISQEKLEKSPMLCSDFIDYLGDMYVCVGFDENYCENEKGRLVGQAIDFLAWCNRKNDNL